jgi:chromosome segregation ATPase
MFIFKPKYARIEDQKPGGEQPQEQAKEEAPMTSPDRVTAALSADIIKLKAQFDQFAEMRKVFNERFTRTNEQIGELRGMIMDSNRAMQDVEVKTVKAVDLVEAVHPDKLMVDVRKQDAKIEALKANIESNETIMKSLMDQIKELRHQLTAFRGIEEMVKLSDEVKKELMNIKKVEATVERHSDKIEGIFIESQKKFQEFETLTEKLKEMQKQLGPVITQVDQMKVKMTTTAAKKDVENLITRLNDFEKHVGNIIDLITKRANDLPRDVDQRYKRLEASMNDAFQKHIKRAETMNALIDKIEKNAGRISRELEITEKLQGVDVKKIESQPSAEIKESVKKSEEERKGLFAGLFAKKEEKK